MGTRTVRRIAIVGVGLVGGSIGLAARRGLRGTSVAGVDRRRVLARALRRGAIHEGHTSLKAGLAGADLIVLALPVDRIIRHLPSVGRFSEADAIVTDVGSTKVEILRAAARAGLGARFVGGHPMAGSEKTGIEHARESLLRRAAWILCAAPDGSAAGVVAGVVRRLGARPIALDAKRHDHLMARLSHLPQIASVALVNAASRGVPSRAPVLAGPAFREMSRLAESPEAIWRGILDTNRAAIAASLDDLIAELRAMRAKLPRGLGPAFGRAARARGRLVPRAGRAGGSVR